MLHGPVHRLATANDTCAKGARLANAGAGAAILAAALLASAGARAQEAVNPSFRDVISLRSVGGLALEPDGGAVAYAVRTVDWENDGYDIEIWLWQPGSWANQATRTEDGISTSPVWSPDCRWLGFLADCGSGTRLHVLPVAGGEAVPAM